MQITSPACEVTVANYFCGLRWQTDATLLLCLGNDGAARIWIGRILGLGRIGYGFVVHRAIALQPSLFREESHMNRSIPIGISTALVAAGVLAGGFRSPAAIPNTLLAKVKHTHQLVIAESAFAPQDFQNPKTKRWTGYDVGILRAFAKTLGAHLKVDALPFASSIEAVASKRADITIDIYYTKARARVISFSRPMLNYNDVVAVNSVHPKVTKDILPALKGKRIAVVVGSEEVSEANAIPNATVKEYGSVAESFLALSSGRVAADLQPDTDVAWAKKQNKSLKIKILGPVPKKIAPPIKSLRGYYGVPKGPYSHTFLLKLNAFLKKIAKNGVEQRILDQYGMKNPVFLKGIANAPNVYK